MTVLIIEQISAREAAEISHVFPQPIADAGFRLHRLLVIHVSSIQFSFLDIEDLYQLVNLDWVKIVNTCGTEFNFQEKDKEIV